METFKEVKLYNNQPLNKMIILHLLILAHCLAGAFFIFKLYHS